MPDVIYSGEVIVVGRRDSSGAFWGYALNESGGYSQHQQLEPGGGGGAPEWAFSAFEHHHVVCQGADAAAKSIADKIKQTDDGGSPNNWRVNEYGAFVVRHNTEGEFRPHEWRVHTNNRPIGVNLGAPPNQSFDVAGIVHNHPGGANPEVGLRNLKSYPSAEDMDRFDALMLDMKIPSDASLWIIDPIGNLRSFKADSFSGIRAKSEAQLSAGENLPNPIEAAGSCRSLVP